MNDSLRKLLREGRISQPIHKSWNEEEWQAAFDEISEPSEDDQELLRLGIETARSLTLIRNRALATAKEIAGDPRTERLMIASSNRDFYVMSDASDEKLDKRADLVLADSLGGDKLPIGPHGELVDTLGLLDGGVESVRFPLSLAMQQGVGKKHPPKALLRAAHAMKVLGGAYESVENTWSACLWDGYKPTWNDEGLVVHPEDGPSGDAHAVQFHRHQALLNEITMRAVQAWHTDDRIRTLAKLGDIAVEIDSNGGYVQIGNATDQGVTLSLLMQLAGEEFYWDDLLSIPLPKLHDITVRQLLRAWMAVSALAEAHLRNRPDDTDAQTLSELRRFAPMISRSDLTRLLTDGLQVSDASIVDSILSIFSYPGGLVDTWHYPIVGCGPDRFALHVPVACTGNLIRCIEHWLTKGGADLALRGQAFEDYIRGVMDSTRPCKALHGRLVTRNENTVIRCGETEEEIDLLFLVGDTLFVGECKCVLQASTPMERYRLRSRLLEGAKQAQRKAAFLQANPECAAEHLGWPITQSTRFVPLVVSNLAIGSGYPVGGVPVVDQYILRKPIETGAIRLIVDPRTETAMHQAEVFQEGVDPGDALSRFYADPPHIRFLEPFVRDAVFPVPSFGEEGTSRFMKQRVVDMGMLEAALRNAADRARGDD